MRLPDPLEARRSPVPYGRPVAVPVWTPPTQPPDFLDGLRKIWRHRGLVVCCTIAFAIGSAILVYRLPTYYTAETRIQVGVPDVQIFSNEVRAMPGLATASDKVENERIAVQSRDLARQVVDKLQLGNDPEFNPALNTSKSWFDYINPLAYIPPITREIRSWIGPKAPPPQPESAAETENHLIDALLGHLDVSTLGRSQVLSVQVSSRDPDKAATIANTLASVYLTSQKNLKAADSNRIEGYLGERITELRQQVEKSQRAVAEYRKKYGLYQGTSASVTSQQLTELNTQLIDAQTAKAEADSRLSEAVALKKRGVTGDSLPDVLSSPVIQALKAQQAEAAQTLAQLSSNYGPRHPKVLNARAAMNDINAKLSAEVSRVIDSLRHAAATADARYDALQRNFDHLKTQVGGVNEQSIELQSLEREATVNGNLLEAMLNRAKETIGREEIEQPDARLVSPAAPPQAPSYPPKTLIMLLGTLGGLLLGALFALLRDSVDRTFRRADEVEQATGLPVLSMVPDVKGATSPALQILRTPGSTYSEALRKIYIGLQLSVKGDTPKTILISSATPSEGKSMMAASLGRLMAKNGKRVLVIDCDWRSPTLHRIFQCSNRYGLAQLMTEDTVSAASAIFNDPLSGLDVLVSGGWTPRSSEMLMSDRLGAMLRTFSKNYDLVILDSPPVLVSSEVLVLSRLVDKTVFVVRWGHTRREAVLDALRQLIDAQSDVAGVVMSRVDAKRYRDFAYAHMNYDYGGTTLARIA
jgi:capsular exopolysaccharide synthesis family protein